MRRLACLFVLALTLAPAAVAGGYPGGYVQQQQYAAPYRQQNAYVEKVYYQFLPVLTPGEFYGGMVAGQLKYERAKAQAEQQGADLASRVDRLAAAVEGLQRSIGQPGPLPTPQPPVMPAPAPSQPPTTPSPVVPPAAEPPPAAVLEILSTHCLKCHVAPAKAGGGFVLFDAPESPKLLADLGPFDLLAIDQMVYSGAMPPDKPLAKEEYDTLRGWINDSQEEITAAIKAAAKSTASTQTKGK